MWVLSLFLFVFGLCIPVISQALIYPVVFWLLIFWKGRVIKDFVIQISILAMFCATYYLVSYGYGYVSFAYVIHRPLLFIGLYGLGYYLGKRRGPAWPDSLVLPLIAFVAGFACYTFLLFYNITPTQLSEAASSRTIDSFWRGGQSDIATIIGLYASLGLCLAPVLLFMARRKIRSYQAWVFSAIIILFVVNALFIIIVFQDRTPLVALALSFIACLGVFLLSKQEDSGSGNKKLFKALLIFVGLGIAAFAVMSYVNLSDVFVRFSNKGLDTPRFAAWADMISELPAHLAGGRTAAINGLNYVHDTWLDVAYTAGVLPFLFLLIFNISHFWSTFKVIKSGFPQLLRLIICALGVSFVTGLFVEPVLSGYPYYFGLSCLFFGMARRLSREYNRGHLDNLHQQAYAYAPEPVVNS